MARVELLIDPLRISQQQIDIEVSDHVEAHAARPKVRAHLMALRADVMRVRMDRQAFRLFEDMEGLAQLTVVPVSARAELARKIQGTLPVWCTDSFIVNFSLLDRIFPATQEFLSLNVDLKILYLIAPALVTATSPEQLLFAIRKSSVPIQRLLSGEVKSHIEGILAAKLDQPEIVMVFSSLQVDNFALQLDAIFLEVLFEKIRNFVSRTGLTFTVPPRQMPFSLTSKLVLTPEWWDALDIGKTVVSLTQRVIQSIEKGQLGAKEIPPIIFGYSKIQLETIMLVIEAQPELATEALLDAVRNLGRADTLDFENAIQSQLQVAPPALLDINSSAKEAMDWAKGYLQYAANAFRRSSEPENVISKSFSDWASAQPARLNNTQWNWRAVSTAVRKALEDEKIVVLLVVDALGAILSKPLVEQLRGIDGNLHVEEQILFAPLPTITEIGKLAVATGKDVHKLSGDAQTSIDATYKGLLSHPAEYQFLKGWVAGAKIMEPSTRLLVLFENQLDDQLHECLHYGDLAAQLQIVFSKIGKWVMQWILEAETRGKDIEIFITADHGLTKAASVREFLMKKQDGIVGERHVRVTNSKFPIPPGFYRISAEGAPESCYLIPHDRVRLINKPTPFSHGGMTPEEVLIPLISVRPIRRDEGRPIRLHLERTLASLSNDGWSVQLVLTAGSAPLHSILVQAAAPFSGEQKVNALAANESVALTLHLRSSVPQEGGVAVGFALRFLALGATTYIVSGVNLDIMLQPRVLIRGKGEIDFDSMFD